MQLFVHIFIKNNLKNETKIKIVFSFENSKEIYLILYIFCILFTLYISYIFSAYVRYDILNIMNILLNLELDHKIFIILVIFFNIFQFIISFIHYIYLDML